VVYAWKTVDGPPVKRREKDGWEPPSGILPGEAVSTCERGQKNGIGRLAAAECDTSGHEGQFEEAVASGIGGKSIQDH
jgi:hypothetical protein